MKFILGLLLGVGLLCGQTVNGSTVSGGQTATFTISVKKIPKLTVTATCVGTQDAGGVFQVLAGTSIPCTATFSAAIAAATTLVLVSSDTTSFTVPASVTVPIGATSVIFSITATP